MRVTSVVRAPVLAVADVVEVVAGRHDDVVTSGRQVVGVLLPVGRCCSAVLVFPHLDDVGDIHLQTGCECDRCQHWSR